MNPNLKEQITDIVVYYDVKKNYFYNNESVETQVKNWKHAIKNNDTEALQYTEEDIIDHYQNLLLDKNVTHFLQVGEDIINKVEDRISSFSYQNKISSEIFTLITGIETKGLSNKKLKPIIEDYFYN